VGRTIVYSGSIRRALIGMAKYTTTPISFFLALGWKEGMAYFHDIAEMMQEEAQEIEASTKPKPFDVSAWHRYSG
jgi:hypothetical protein